MAAMQSTYRMFSSWRRHLTKYNRLPVHFRFLFSHANWCYYLFFPLHWDYKKIKFEQKTKWILVVVVKWRHHENGLLVEVYQSYYLMTVGNNSAEYTYAKSNVMVMKTLARTIEKIILPASIPVKQQNDKI